MITRVGDERLVVSSRRARQTFHRGNTRIYELVVARGLKPHLDGRSRKITVTRSVVAPHGGSPPLWSRALVTSRWNPTTLCVREKPYLRQRRLHQ